MAHSDYVKVFSGNLIDTEHLLQNLKAEGIEPITKDTSLGITAVLVTDYQELKEVYVHQSEVEKATAIIESTFPQAN